MYFITTQVYVFASKGLFMYTHTTNRISIKHQEISKSQLSF